MSNDNKIFLPHLYEPLRRQIAIQYIQHEWRKLFPQLRGKELWQAIDKQIVDWYEMLSIRNFWNAVHGITIGFRLTSIVPWITSLNIKWEEKEVPFNELYFRGKFGPISSLKVDSPDFVSSVKKAIFLSENLNIMQYARLLASLLQNRRFTNIGCRHLYLSILFFGINIIARQDATL